MSFNRIDLHIVTLLIMFLLAFLGIVPSFLKLNISACSIGLSLGIIMFLLPQGIILTRVLKRKGFKFYITNKEYFYTNELLALFSLFISSLMVKLIEVIT